MRNAATPLLWDNRKAHLNDTGHTWKKKKVTLVTNMAEEHEAMKLGDGPIFLQSYTLKPLKYIIHATQKKKKKDISSWLPYCTNILLALQWLGFRHFTTMKMYQHGIY